MVTAILQFNERLFNKMDGGRHSWDGAKAGHHFITYVDKVGRVNFRENTYPKPDSFYDRRHNNSFKLFLIY